MSSNLCNVDAEEAVLGSLLHADVDVADVAALESADFTSSSRAAAFQALRQLHHDRRPVDLVIAADALRRVDGLDLVGGALELTRLFDRVPSGANAGEHAAIVCELADRRRIQQAAQQLTRDAGDRHIPIGELRLEPLTAPRATNGLEWRGVDGLLGEPDAEVSFLVHNLMAEAATTLLVAKPKIGKSTFVFGILQALEQGRSFAGHQVKQATAIVLSEEGRGTLLQKVRRFGIRHARFLTRADMLRCSRFSDVIAAAVAEAKRVGAKLIVVDSLSPWARLGPDAEKDAGSIALAMEPLLAAAAEGFAVLVVHHTRKLPGDQGDAVRGSGAIFQSVETLLELRRLDPKTTSSTTRVITVTSRFEGLPAELCVDLRGDEYVALPSTTDARTHEARRRILNVLTTEWMTREMVLERAGGNAAETGKALTALANDLAIEREGRGRSGDPYRFRQNGPVEITPDEQPESSSSVRRSPIGNGTAERTFDEQAVPDLRNRSESRNGPDPFGGEVAAESRGA